MKTFAGLGLTLALTIAAFSSPAHACSFVRHEPYMPHDLMRPTIKSKEYDWSKIPTPTMAITGLKRGSHEAVDSCFDLGWFTITIAFEEGAVKDLENFGLSLKVEKGDFPMPADLEAPFVPELEGNTLTARVIWIDQGEKLSKPLDFTIAAQLVTPNMNQGPKYKIDVKARPVYRKLD